MTYRREAQRARSRTPTIIVQPPAPPPAPAPEPDKGRGFDRGIAIATLVSTTVLAVASLVLAKVGLDVTKGFNGWQIAESKRNERKAVGDERDAKRQYCVQMALTAVGIMASNKEEAVGRVTGSISAIREECAAVAIDVPKLVMNVAARAKKNETASIAAGPQPGSQTRPAAPDVVTIKKVGDGLYKGGWRFGFLGVGGGPASGAHIPDKTVDDAIVASSDKLVTPAPRATEGVGVNWNSPFGPLRVDLGKPLPNDLPKDKDGKVIGFNVGTQF